MLRWHASTAATESVVVDHDDGKAELAKRTNDA